MRFRDVCGCDRLQPNFTNCGQSPSFSDLSGVTVTQCAGLYTGDAGTAGVDTFTAAAAMGLSNAAIYTTAPAVPEPETYALMFAGLGVVGLVVRRRKRQARGSLGPAPRGKWLRHFP